ncbi:MAG TPA: DinB family protein [Chryseosolibacter sp.]
MKTTQLLTTLKQQTEEIVRTVETKFAGLPDDQLNAKPGPGRWSILECFEHLNLYNQYYLTALENALSKSSAAAYNQDMKYTWIGKKSIAMMNPSNKKKQKTFRKMVPSTSRLTRDVLATFLNDQQRILQLIDRSFSVNATRSVVPVEFFKLLKMNITETLEFVIVHEQRHVLQAENVLKLNTSSEPALSV